MYSDSRRELNTPVVEAISFDYAFNSRCDFCFFGSLVCLASIDRMVRCSTCCVLQPCSSSIFNDEHFKSSNGSLLFPGRIATRSVNGATAVCYSHCRHPALPVLCHWYSGYCIDPNGGKHPFPCQNSALRNFGVVWRARYSNCVTLSINSRYTFSRSLIL